jgi:Na+-driven multidrug efflux pump
MTSDPTAILDAIVNNIGETRFLILVSLIATAFGLIPWFIALARSHRNTSGIFVFCFFLSWTMIGWVIALVWAFWNDQNPAPRPKSNPFAA